MGRPQLQRTVCIRRQSEVVVAQSNFFRRNVPAPALSKGYIDSIGPLDQLAKDESRGESDRCTQHEMLIVNITGGQLLTSHMTANIKSGTT